MKKKLTLIATAVALGALAVVGATMAYFTSQDTATNVITTGNVKIQVLEYDENGHVIDPAKKENEFKNLVPGTEIFKRPSVNNIGDNLAIVRAWVEFVKPGEKEPVDEGYFANGVPILNRDESDETTGWKYDGSHYYYYDKVLNTGTDIDSRTDEIFSTVIIPTTWVNEDVNKEFDIIIYAEAVQAENLVEGELTDLNIGIEAVKKAFEKYDSSKSKPE